MANSDDRKKEFDAIFEKMDAKYGVKKKTAGSSATTTVPSVSTGATSQGNRQAEFDAIFSKMDAKYGVKKTASTTMDISKVNDWFKNAKTISDRGYRYLVLEEGWKKPNTSLAGDIDRYLSQHNDVRQFISANGNNYEAMKAYREIIDYMEELRKGIVSTNNFYSQFKSHDEYDKWKVYYDAWGHYFDEADFDEYAAKGAAIENPKFEDAENNGRFLWWSWEGDEVGNIVTYSRENYDMLMAAYMHNEHTRGNHLYHYMRDEEVNLYNYLLTKEGKEVADSYLSYLEPQLAEAEGRQISSNLTSIDIPVLEELAVGSFGVLSGIDNWASGTRQWLTGEDQPATVEQYANSSIANSLDGLGKYAYQATNVVGNMLPSILVSRGLGAMGVGAKAAKLGGVATMGVGVAGNSYGDALDDGYSEWQARLYGGVTGALEGGLEYFIGGIPALSKADDFLTAKIKMVDDAFLRIGAKLGWDTIKEIGEEEAQNYLEPLVRSFIFGEEYTAPTFEALLETAIVTAISTPILGGVDTVAEDVIKSNYYKGTYGANAQDLILEGLESPEGTISHDLAAKYQARLDAGKNLNGHQLGRMVEANEQQFRSEDMANIQAATESRLTELGETGDVVAIAAALTKQAAGQKLTRAEQQAISNSKYGQRVANEMNTENIISGEYSSGWAENIGTERINAQEYSRLVEAAQLPQETAESTGSQVATKAPRAAQVVQPDAVEAPAANDQQVTGKLTGKEAGPVAEESTVGDEAELSVDGKTFQKSTGKPVEIKRFSAVGSEDATVVTNSGDEISLSDVSFGSEGEAVLLESLTSFDHITTEAANTILQAFRSNGNHSSAVSFTAGAAHIFKSGYHSAKPSTEYTSKLTQNQVDLIYNAGQEAAREHYRTEQKKKVDAKKKTAAEKKATTKKGGVYYGYEGQTIDQRKVDDTHKELTKAQAVGVDFVKRMAQKFGMVFYFYESYTNADGNWVYQDANGNVVPAEDGFYDPRDGSIHIDLNAGRNGDGKILFVIAHELVHHIKEQSPAHFKAMADIVVQGFASRDVPLDKLIADAQKAALERGRNLTEDEAFEEVIAHSLEGILADGKVMEFMSKLEAKNQSLGAKVKRFFQNVAKMIWDTIEAYRGVKPDSVEGRMIMRMEDVYNQLQKVFAEGVYEAGENFQAAEKSTSNNGGSKVKFANRISLLTDEDILELIENCNRGEYALRTFIPVRKDTPSILLEKSKLEGLKPLENRPVIMLVEHVQQCMDDDVAAVDGKRGHALTAQNILAITKSLDDPKYIFFQQDNERYSLIVEYDIGTRNERGMAIVDVTRDKNPDQMNGFEGGKYNILVTAYAPDSEFLKKYIKSENNKCIYNKTEDDPQGSSGSLVPSLLNGSSSSSTLAQLETVVKEKDSAIVDTETIEDVRSDIRYASRQDVDAVTELIRKENEKLRTDVGKLKELLKLQRTVTNGTKFTPTSVEAAARMLKKQANSTGSTTELAGLLNNFYEYIATEQELTWDGVKEQAQAAADWLQDHVKQQRSEYAQDILDQLHGSRIYLDESQKAEAAHRFGSFNDFRRSVMGSVIIANDANMSLDSLWHEMSTLYPYMFDPELSASDMPGVLADIIDQLRNEDTSFMEYEYNRELITQNLIRQVYDSYWNVSTLRTFADVKQAQINRLKGEHIQRMNKLKTESREKIEQIKAEHRAEVDMIRSAYRQKLDKHQKDLSAKYQESRKRDLEQRKESAEVAKQRGKIEKQVKSLMTMLAHPTKDAHVPLSLQAPLQEFLESIDFTSKSQNAGQGTTIRDVYYTRALTEVRDAVAAQSSAMRGTEDGVYELDVPESFLLEIDKHIQTIHSATKGLDMTTNRLYDMNSAELSDLSHILGVINKTIRDIDRLHMAGAKARVSELGRGTMTELSGRKAVRTDNGYRAMWANYTPYYAFLRMGKAAQQIFCGLTQGQSKLARTVNAILEFVDKTYEADDVKAWEKEIHDIELESGQTVKITTAQLMSFYCLSKRKHALGHLTGGGIRVDTIKHNAVDAIKNRAKEIVQKEHYVLTENDISAINELLEKDSKALSVAKALQQYMQDFGGRLINEVSMARWDYMAATEHNYFPIRTDDLTRDARSPDQDRTHLWALLNKSFTKGLTEGANNALVVASIFDVFADHMSECAEYNAFALPLVDAMRWFNYRERIKLDGTQVKDVGVQKSMESALGKAAIKYFTDLMTDINGSQKAGRYENLAGKVLSRAKVSAVAWNLRVAMQQPTAILRASLVLDMPSLMKGAVRIGTKELVQEMQQYSGMALWKSMGYYDLNVSRSVREQIKRDLSTLDKFNEAGMWLPEKMDEITWARIWAACKSKVAKEQKIAGESLLKATAELFEDVVYQTQVADSVLTRSALMRSKSQTIKEATSFMAEPTLSYNILLSAFQDYKIGHTTWEKAKRGMMIGFYGYVLSAVANAIVSSLVDAWRDDDEYEDFWEKFRQALLGEKSLADGNLFAELNPLEKIAFVKDIISQTKGYSNATSYADLIDSVIGLFDVVKNFSEGKGTLTYYGVFYKGMQTLGTMSGVGLAGMTREATAIWNNTVGKMHPNMMLHIKKESTKTKIRNAYDIGALSAEEAMWYLVQDGAVETEDDAYWEVDAWEYASETGSSKGYSKYGDFYTAVETGKNLKAVIKEYTNNGVENKTLASQITTYFKPLYKEMSNYERASIKGYLLNAYELLGYDRTKKSKDIDKWLES